MKMVARKCVHVVYLTNFKRVFAKVHGVWWKCVSWRYDNGGKRVVFSGIDAPRWQNRMTRHGFTFYIRRGVLDLLKRCLRRDVSCCRFVNSSLNHIHLRWSHLWSQYSPEISTGRVIRLLDHYSCFEHDNQCGHSTIQWQFFFRYFSYLLQLLYYSYIKFSRIFWNIKLKNSKNILNKFEKIENTVISQIMRDSLLNE